MKKELISNRLNFIKRMRILENRDLKKGIRLNRNERVEDFPKGMLQKILKVYPNIIWENILIIVKFINIFQNILI